MAELLGEVSLLLARIHEGDRSAETRLLELVYKDLRRLAAYQLQGERSDHSLQPTALVHEAYLKVFGQSSPSARSRAHFMALASKVMKQLLVDHARSRQANKRGGQHGKLALDQVLVYYDDRADELLAINEALDRLRSWAPRPSQIVELRFFGGLEEKEIAEYLEVSLRTVKRDWAMARAWLSAELAA